tara:strand:- start:696 stop:1211 length:516 start_codon:yes stop_codon:yes gene_type:complete
MAIRDKSRKPYIEDNNSNVKIGIDLPIRRGEGEGGFFASTSTTIEAVKNNIRNLLSTNEGERFFQPNLGLNLRKVLFENMTEEKLISVQDSILDKFEIFLPFVEIRDIQIRTRDSDSVVGSSEVRLEIIFNIKQDPNTLESVSLDFSSNAVSEAESTSIGSSIGGAGGGGY